MRTQLGRGTVVAGTVLSLVAFAANSLLCRMALGRELIDPISFTSIRLLSGAVMLLALVAWLEAPAESSPSRGRWSGALALFVYAAGFSMAYVALDTGIGALILFGAVQLTMMSIAWHRGERMNTGQWLGFVVALGGLLYLLLPGVSAPAPVAASLMVVAGIAWGCYTVLGKGAVAPISMTAGNFVKALPLTFAASLLAINALEVASMGALLAMTSGAVTSGLGYALWYKTLPSLSTNQAAVLQLLVPVLAAVAGVLVLDEQLTPRLVIASVLILGGVLLAVRPVAKPRP